MRCIQIQPSTKSVSNFMKKKIAIIGTGLAGLVCADRLSPDFEISLFDKSRGMSGRLSTRRAQSGETVFAFDHGAQYFSARSVAFKNWLEPLEAKGHVRRWQPRIVTISATGSAPRPTSEKFVFSPSMNSVGKVKFSVSAHKQLYLDTPVAAIDGAPGAWRLNCGESFFGPFEHVVLAVPAPQALALLPPNADFVGRVQDVQMLGCHTLMLGYLPQKDIAADWHCAFFDDALLGFAAFNCRKPDRNGGTSLVVQTRHDWSQAHIEDELEGVAELMAHRFKDLTGLSPAAGGYYRLHRWRYASVEQPAGAKYLHDDALKLSATGDWCLGSKVEDAFTSGYCLAEKLNAQ